MPTNGSGTGASLPGPNTDPTPATSSSASSVADGPGEVIPRYLDIVGMRAEAAPGMVTLALDLADAVPAGSPQVGQLAYSFYLDVDADGAWDYTASLALVPEGGFRPALIDRRSGGRLEGPRYPGTANLAGRSITLTVQLDAIGCPPVVGVRAASEQTKGGSTAGDQVPDAIGEWIPVATDCPPAGT
jgi:hypothetical protein